MVPGGPFHAVMLQKYFMHTMVNKTLDEINKIFYVLKPHTQLEHLIIAKIPFGLNRPMATKEINLNIVRVEY